MMTTSRSKGGFVYVLVNRAWPGRVKIGCTTNPDKRLGQYQTATPYRDFEYAAVAWFQDHITAEKLLLARFNTTGEWAEVDSYFAVKTLNQLKEELSDDGLRSEE